MDVIEDLIDFLNENPTPWHAVESIRNKLESSGFITLKEGEEWNLEPGMSYYVERGGSSLCAFVAPLQSPKAVRLIASHTDSPGLKLKPNPEFRKENMVMLGVDIYGGPLLSSWLNRDLGIAGRIIYRESNGEFKECLVNITDAPLVIPQLAIHLDRNVNESGPILNKQDHLAALAAVDIPPDVSYLKTLLKSHVPAEWLSHDLFLYPLEKARRIGPEGQLIAGYRLDNLASVHASLPGLLNSPKPHSDTIKMAMFWNHEEVGSSTAEGAGSPFLSHTLERISLAYGDTREDYLRLLSRSLCISVDLAHALHPNYTEKHDPRHGPLLNKGTVIKYNAQQRYATDARSAAQIIDLCRQNNLPLQAFTNRGDMPSGSTIGPISSSLTGIPTVDIGSPQLSMHASRELCGCQDHLDLCALLEHFFLKA